MSLRSAFLRVMPVAILAILPWPAVVGSGFEDGQPGDTATIVVGEGDASLADDLSRAFVSADRLPASAAGAAPGVEESTVTTPFETGSARNSSGSSKSLFLPVQPRWQAQIDALMLWQGNIPSRVLYTSWPSNAAALDVNQAQSAMTAGVRYGLLLNLDPVYAIEGNYFNVSSFNGAAATPAGTYAQNNLAAPSVGPNDGIIFTSANVATSGAIGSAELNWRRRTGTPVTWLAGFRWVEWNQGMSINDRFVFDPLVGLPPGTSRLDVSTGNNLYGGQLGMDLCLWNRWAGAVQVNGLGKAGVFYNRASYQRSIGTFMQDGQPPEVLGPVAATADQTSFVGELGVNASVRITNWLSWRAGYSLFWLTCVATPANQLAVTNLMDFPPTALIDTNGSVLLHGATTGLEARW
ncbi:MAG: BBP7 family outer membrane beta-barrel protein [Planctomycetaceae bacterium]